jgi:cardiolipin synthase (CMP-forming)
MTTANKVTILRILLVPVFVIELLYYIRTGNETHRFAAVICFAVASVSDAVDGYLARRYNQRSELGAILDPLADKLLLVSAILLLSMDNEPYLRRIPLWLTGLILSRDVLLVLGALVIHYLVGHFEVRPRIPGKIATVFQMVVVSWILLHWDKDAVPWFLAGAGFFTTLSGLYYLWDWIRHLSKSPASLPSEKKT